MPHPLVTNNKASIDAPNSALAPLAAAISFALTASIAPSLAHAQEAAPTKQTEPRQLSKLVAKDAEEEIKIDKVASPKFTQPLLDTPQTITVVSKEVLRQQGAATLVEALANTPGITMQLGENGNTSAGDVFSIRGSASQTNIYVDGVRDLGAISRDIFNVEQVEIAKGAVGADYGRGAISGYINLASKVPQLDNFGGATFTANTGVTVRATSDINKEIGSNSAIRFNAMWQNGDVVGRDYVEQNRWGLAPSIAFGLNTDTRLYVYSQHVRARNTPDGGIPAIGFAGFYNKGLADRGVSPAPVDSENYYGRFDDFENTNSDMGTVRIEHDFSDTFKLINTSRYGKSSMNRVVTGVNALCLFGTTSTATTNPACTATPTSLLVPASSPDQWLVTRSRQSTVQKNEVLTNQTNVTASFNTGFIKHDLTTGLELIKERQDSPGFGNIGTLPLANLYNPNANDAYIVNAFTPAYARAATGALSIGETKTYAGYAFDTLSFGTRWLLTAGGRYERYETAFDAFTLATTGTTPTPASVTNLDRSAGLFSWKTGLVFKPTKFGSVYVSYSNALTPAGNDAFTLSAAANNINRPNFDPQEARNTEIGTKWDLINERLSVNLALYRTVNKNQLVILDPVLNDYVQYGSRRVQGAEFGVVGKLTEHWAVIAGAAWSDNEQLSGATTGTNSTGSSARWAPDYSANLWTTYTVSKWSAGLGLNYVDEQKLVTDPNANLATTAGLTGIPGYTVFNGMVSYNITDAVGLQVNVYNLFDKDYITSLNNGGSRVRLGTPRYAQATVSFKF